MPRFQIVFSSCYRLISNFKREIVNIYLDLVLHQTLPNEPIYHPQHLDHGSIDQLDFEMTSSCMKSLVDLEVPCHEPVSAGCHCVRLVVSLEQMETGFLGPCVILDCHRARRHRLLRYVVEWDPSEFGPSYYSSLCKNNS